MSADTLLATAEDRQARVYKNTVAQKKRLISFVLPLYNEDGNLQDLYQKITAVMTNQPDDYELLFIDDGSTDSSFDVLHDIQANDKKVKVIRFRRNFGKAAAYSAGFQKARGEIIITMDTDLQDDPDDIPLFIAKINEGYDLVVGWRQKRKAPLEKTLPSKIFNKIVPLVTGVKLHDCNCPFKAYRKEVIEEIKVHGELHRYIPVLASSKGFSLTEISVSNLPRVYGESKYGIARYPQGMLDLLTILFITRFSKRPLHLLGLGGIVACLLGLGVLLFLVFAHFLYSFGMLTESSWIIHDRPAMSLGILLMIVGTQFFSIGLLGELLVTENASNVNDKGYSIAKTLEDNPDRADL